MSMAADAVVAGDVAPRAIVMVFNRYLVELVVLLKTHGGAVASRALIAARHRAIDADSDAYIRHATSNGLPALVLAAASGHVDVLDMALDLMQKDVVLQGVPLCSLVPSKDAMLLPVDTCGDAARARTLLHFLAALAAAHAPEEPALEKLTLSVLGRLQKPTTDADRSGAILDAVLEDDVRRHLDLIRTLLNAGDAGDAGDAAGEGSGVDADDDDIAKMMESSKLGALAREILDDIGPDALEGLSKDPPTAFDFSQITDANSPIGSLVQKAGSKLVSKLTSGELDKNELIESLMKMMGAFGAGGPGGPSSGAGGGGGAGAGGMPTGMADMMTSMSGMLQGMQSKQQAVAPSRGGSARHIRRH